jgi:hypothetical protein
LGGQAPGSSLSGIWRGAHRKLAFAHESDRGGSQGASMGGTGANPGGGRVVDHALLWLKTGNAR